MGLEHRRRAHSVRAIAFHGDRVKEIVTEQANALGCEILEIETDTDHVYVLVRVKPIQRRLRSENLSRVPTLEVSFVGRPPLVSLVLRRHGWRCATLNHPNSTSSLREQVNDRMAL